MPWKFFNASGQEKRATVSAPSSVPVEGVHYIGAAGEPGFQNSWVNYTAGGPSRALRSAGFWKDPAGYVHLTGLIKNGTYPLPAFTLPVGYRPAATNSYEVNSNELRGEVAVDVNGLVSPAVGSTAYVYLEGIVFDTGQPTFPTGPAGPPSDVRVQASEPSGVSPGTIWVDTDAPVVYGPPIVSTLPVSPSDGQEVYFQDSAMAALGIVWHLRYRVAGGTYKWEYVGGQEMINAVDSPDSSTTSTTYAQLTLPGVSPGPTVTVPLLGTYMVKLGALMYGSNATVRQSRMSYDVNATGALDVDAITASVSDTAFGMMSRQMVRTFTAGAVLLAKYKTNNGTLTNTYAFRTLSILPIAVG